MPDSTLLRVLCFLICEKTEVRMPGTFSIINASNTLGSSSVPVTANFTVALAMQGNPGDRGTTKQVTLRVMDEDSKILGATTAEFTFPNDEINPEPVFLGSFQVQQVTFSQFGNYQVEILEESTVLHNQYMRLNQVPPQQTPPLSNRAQRRRQDRGRH